MQYKDNIFMKYKNGTMRIVSHDPVIPGKEIHTHTDGNGIRHYQKVNSILKQHTTPGNWSEGFIPPTTYVVDFVN